MEKSDLACRWSFSYPLYFVLRGKSFMLVRNAKMLNMGVNSNLKDADSDRK